MKRATWVHVGKLSMVIGIMLIAFFPRAIEMFSGNFLFGFDQGKHWLAAKSIVVDHVFPLIGDPVGGTGGFFQGPGWYYVLTIPFLFWKGNPQGSIVLMVLSGMLTVGLACWIFRKIFGYTEAILAGLLLAISPAIIIQSRFAWPPFIIPPLTVLYLGALYGAISRRPFYLFWTFFMCGVMAHFEIATALTLLFPTLIVMVFVARLQKISFRDVVLAPVGFLIPLAPLFVFDLRHNFLNLRGVVSMATSGDAHPFNTHIATFATNMFGAYETIPLPRWLFIASHGIVLLLIGFDRKVSKEKKLFLAVLVAIPLLVYLEFLGYTAQMWEWWLLELPVMYIVLTGYCAAYLWKKYVPGKIVIGALIVYFLLLFAQHTMVYYQKDYGDFGGTQKVKGKVQALQYIFNDAKGKPFGLLVFTPPVYTYPYDYLAWWLGTTTYGYVPVGEQMNPFYLLMEPDGNKPWSYKGWMETVVKTGSVVWQKTLPSGFIIEKRIPPSSSMNTSIGDGE